MLINNKKYIKWKKIFPYAFLSIIAISSVGVITSCVQHTNKKYLTYDSDLSTNSDPISYTYNNDAKEIHVVNKSNMDGTILYLKLSNSYVESWSSLDYNRDTGVIRIDFDGYFVAPFNHDLVKNQNVLEILNAVADEYSKIDNVWVDMPDLFEPYHHSYLPYNFMESYFKYVFNITFRPAGSSISSFPLYFFNSANSTFFQTKEQLDLCLLKMNSTSRLILGTQPVFQDSMDIISIEYIQPLYITNGENK